MKNPKKLILPGLIIGCLCLAGCNRYQVTLNERIIHTPPLLFTDFKMADPGLQACITQTISDRGITTPDQLQVLNCSNGEIASLEGLRLFSHIHTVNLANNKLTDINLLLFMGQLKSVNLEGNPALDCKDADILKTQLPERVILPGHCR